MPDRRGFFKVSSHERQVIGALGSIGLATLASRVLGFVRDMVVALVFGAGPVTDAFFVAFRIPNILRRLRRRRRPAPPCVRRRVRAR